MERITLKLAGDSELGRDGQIMTFSLTPTDVRIQEELSTYLAGYADFGFRADEMSTVILVDADTDKFRNFSLENTFQPVNVKGSIEGAVPEIDTRTALSEYKVVDRFIGSFINDITASQPTKRYDIRRAAMRRCQRVIQMDREIDVMTLLTTSSSWATAQRLALGAGFGWNQVGSDPVKDLQDMMETSAQAISFFGLNRKVANALLRNASTRDYIRSMNGDAPADATLARINNSPQGAPINFQLPGMPPFRVLEQKYMPGSTLEYIWPNKVIGISEPPGGTPVDGESIATSKTFRRRGGAGVGYETREYRVENRGPKGGTMIVVSMADQAVMTANNAGCLIENVIQ